MEEQAVRPDMAQGSSSSDWEDSGNNLTSLLWLKDFSLANTSLAKSSCCLDGPDPPSSQRCSTLAAPCSALAAEPACGALSHSPCQPISSSASRTQHHTMVLSPQLAQDIDYKSNPYVRPPYTYASLICMAMEASQKPSISLSAIYKWIRDNFSYFRHADPSWQSSIQRNLSLNKCFIRVPREKGEPGRGGFWMLHPEYAQRLKSGACKQSRMPSTHTHMACPATAPQGTGSLATTDTSSGTYTSILAVNRELQQLLKEFEEATNNQTLTAADGKAGQRHKKPSPTPTAKVTRLCSPGLLSQEQQRELGALKDDFDWEALLNTKPSGDFPTFDTLELTPPLTPPASSTEPDPDLMVQDQHIDHLQGQEQVQVLIKSSLNNPDLDETFMPTSLPQRDWDEETSDCLYNCVHIEQLFEDNDASFPADVSEWSSLTSLLSKHSQAPSLRHRRVAASLRHDQQLLKCSEGLERV
ncbi:LOW QUALITY PROTEIN: forkhead box protein J1-like [Colius striatus]|uniref:LOW QUALITY PROTEIN: forkhead box protein J1-like n=1 Tax=Colius striatus TaxID=57412 RepID=UPI002B1D96F9|nr:LOW QUALITY PROTEIN: forkhead box protein J1-like [Colius striatus]